MSSLLENLSDLILISADAYPENEALKHKDRSLNYVELAFEVKKFASALAGLDLSKQGRVAFFAGKQPEIVVSAFGTCRFGGVFVPINPVLKSEQAAYILRDCDVQILVTTQGRLETLIPVLDDCSSLRKIIVIDRDEITGNALNQKLVSWNELPGLAGSKAFPRTISSDMAAIMYTSGSTGKPKGVVLSHANMLTGAQSVSQYLDNNAEDRILAALPLSFDAGLSQLTTGFHAGACVVLHDFFLPRDVVRIMKNERITGLTGVPPLWMQIAEQKWPVDAGQYLRYFANTGGKMPKDTLESLRKIFPNAKPFLMYGLTESFRSTYLPPEEVDRRPDSIGKAVPNVEVMVVKSDGTVCRPGEEGELVHRGPLVSRGYWNDPDRTAERFRPVPGQPKGLPIPELGVWSGDTVRQDEEGFLYFVGRKDEMIKTSGYRVSPTEVEEVAYESGYVAEAAALAIPHRKLGQGILLVAKPKGSKNCPTESLLAEYRKRLPNYMVPLNVEWRDSLPKNANGKLDRKLMASELNDYFDAMIKQ